MGKNSIEMTNGTQQVYFISFTHYKISQKSDKKLTLLT